MSEQTPQIVGAIGDLSVIAPDAGEHFVLHCDRILSMEQKKIIEQGWAEFMPYRKLLVLDKGMRLSVCRAPPASQPESGT